MPPLSHKAFRPSARDTLRIQTDTAKEMHARMIALVSNGEGGLLDRSVQVQYNQGAADLGGTWTAARVEWSPGLTSLVTLELTGNGEPFSEPFKHFTLTEKGDFFPHREYMDQDGAANILLLEQGKDTLVKIEAAAARV